MMHRWQFDKRRQAHNVAEVLNVIGDVEGKTAVLVDDDRHWRHHIRRSQVTTPRGRIMYACATHAVFSTGESAAVDERLV